MRAKLVIAAIVLSLINAAYAATDQKGASPAMTAADIAARNAAARGGLQSWRSVRTLSESGKLTAGGDQRKPQAPTPGLKGAARTQTLAAGSRLKEEAQLPFVMELERPRKMRFELQFNGMKAVQVYDGTNGWKLRPYLNRQDVEPYTQDELRLASLQSDLDGPLMDYAEKGTRIELDGTEKVENRDTYRLKLTTKDNHSVRVWVDAQTFLEAKMEGQPRRLDGKEHPVEVYYRDYRTVDGLVLPFLLETRVLPLKTAAGKPAETAYPAEKIMIDKIVVNPKLDAMAFVKPAVQQATLKQPAFQQPARRP